MPSRLNLSVDSLGVWPLRAMWLLLPILAGFGLSEALNEHSERVATTAEVALWVGWFIGLVSVLAPSAASLTAVRLLAPSAVASALWAVFSSGIWEATTIGAIGATLVVFAVALLPTTGDVMVNGSSYGPERRMALRPPAALLLGPIQVAWLVIFVGLAGGIMLIAAGNVLLGAPTLILGIASTWYAGRSLHQLSRRWIVFVPAGVVIHDQWSIAEAFLMKRSEIVSLGPVPLDKGELLDLSGGARGLALLVELDETKTLALRARNAINTFDAYRIVFTPTLPGRLLHKARVRGVKIG